jgi:tetratricopeptide (TPR) repeat protein
MLGDLQGSGLFGLSKSAKVQTEYNPGSFGLREEEPEKVIAAMYDLAKLEPGEEQLLCVFSVLPAEPIAFAVLEALQPGNDELDSALRALVRKGWIEFNAEAKQFKCSPVVQAVTRLQVGEHLYEQCKTLVIALIEKLEYAPDATGHLLNTDYLSGALYARYAGSVVEYLENARDEIAVLNERIGRFYRTTGQLEKALSFCEKNHRLRKELYESDMSNPHFKLGLEIAYEKLGDTFTALGNLQKALGYYQDEKRLLVELFESYPNNVSIKNGLAISDLKLGDMQTKLCDLGKALGHYEDGKILFEELYESDPENTSIKNGLAISYTKLGYTQTKLRDLGKALGHYEDGKILFEELYESDPENASYQNGLAASFNYLGSTYTSLGQKEKAFSNFKQFNLLIEELYELNRSNVSFKNGLAVSCANLGEFCRDQRCDVTEARRWFEKAEELLVELVNDAPSYAEFQKNWSQVKKDLAAL